MPSSRVARGEIPDIVDWGLLGYLHSRKFGGTESVDNPSYLLVAGVHLFITHLSRARGGPDRGDGHGISGRQAEELVHGGSGAGDLHPKLQEEAETLVGRDEGQG